VKDERRSVRRGQQPLSLPIGLPESPALEFLHEFVTRSVPQHAPITNLHRRDLFVNDMGLEQAPKPLDVRQLGHVQ